MNQTVKTGGDATMVFASEDEFAECRFKLTSTVNVKITDLALYSATDEEMLHVSAPQASDTENAVYYSVSGIPSPQPQKGVNIVQMGSNPSRTIFVK